MIDEERTLKELGIDINTLTKGSKKEVWTICDHCGKSRGLPFHQASTNRKCLSCVHKGRWSGKNGTAWKGGITPKMKAIRNSDAYKNWRAAVFKRDNYTCLMCNEKGMPIDAHHIEPVRDHKNDLLIFDVNNGVTLCKDCHQKIGSREYEYVETFRKMLSDDT